MSQPATADTREALKQQIAELESKGKFREAAPLKAQLGASSPRPEQALAERAAHIEQLKAAIDQHTSRGEHVAAGRAKAALALALSR